MTLHSGPGAAEQDLGYVRALDGLRGLAVAGVVVFHLHLALGSRPLLPGGYLGVDVFFCLSGFLITRLLLDEHRTADRISLGRFWYRRARRLLPAMFAVVATVLVVVAVDRTTAAVVGSQRGPALSTLLYVANWREVLAGADYFAQFADAPLGHTWSLAIEEQFYLVWPIVVAWLLRRRSPRTIAVGATVAAAASGLWFLWAASRWGLDRAYYGTDTRLTAILAGAALAAGTWQRRADRPPWPVGRHLLGTAAGVGLLAAFAVGREEVLPKGGGLAVAALSTIVVAAAAREQGPIARVLELRPLVALGRLSYSLYLWHVPVIAVLSPQRTGWAGWRLATARIVVTAAVATASYVGLERPIRHSTAPPRRLVPAFGLTTVGCAALAAVLVPTAPPLLAAAGPDGYVPTPDQLEPITALTSDPTTTTEPTPRTMAATTAPTPTTSPQAAPVPDASTTTWTPPTAPPPPTAPSTVPPPARRVERVLVVGDSVAWSLESQLRRASRGRVRVTNRGTIGCNIWRGEPVVLLGRRTEDHPACAEWPQRWSGLLGSVRPQVAMLVLGTSGGDRVLDGEVRGECDPLFRHAFTAHAVEAIDVLSSQGAMVVVTTLAHRSSDPDPDAPARARCLNEALADAVASRPAAELVDLGGLVCPDARCTIERDGHLVRPDGLHYGSDGDPWIGRWLLDQALDPARLARHALRP